MRHHYSIPLMSFYSCAGRDKFIPVQMKITVWFFYFIQIPLVIEVIVTMILAHNYNAKGQHMLVSVIVGAVAALVNKEMIIPNVSRIWWNLWLFFLNSLPTTSCVSSN